MDKKLKPDWDVTKKRFTEFLEGRLEGPIVRIAAWRAGASAPKTPKWLVDPNESWCWLMDWIVNHYGDDAKFEELFDAIEERQAKTRFIGDAFPMFLFFMGPGILSAYLSGNLKFVGDTVWFGCREPMPWDEIMELSLDCRGEWYAKTKETARAVLKRAKGRYIIGMPPIGGPLDVLASLRTTEQLLVDLIDEPQRVAEAIRHCNMCWKRVFDEMTALFDAEGNEGCAGWIGMWSDKPWYLIYSGFSSMLSPKMAAQFVIPHLQELCNHTGRAIYHWDGPGQIPLLDQFLALRNLRAILWVPGVAEEQCGAPKWFPLYKRIAKAGKARILQDGITVANAQSVLDTVGHRDTFLRIWANEREALRFARKLKLPEG